MTRQHTVRIALLVLTALTGAGCDNRREPETSAGAGHQGETHVLTLTPAAQNDIGLAFSVAEVETLAGTMAVPATLIPNQDLEAQVGSLVAGRVKEVLVHAGDNVRVGQELMLIEGLEVGEIKSNFIKAKAELRYAEAAYRRQKTLLEENIGSRKAFLEAQSAYEKARAEFNAEDKRIHAIGLSDDDLLKYVERESEDQGDHSGGVLPIRAPIGGTIVERNVVTGQLVDATTRAFRIINTAVLWADGQVYERDVPRLSGNTGATLTVTAYPGEEFRGNVIFVSPIVDERTRTIVIRVRVSNPNGRLKPQMFGELHIPVGGTATGLVIPAEAVLAENDARYAFVATSDTTFERRTVEIGMSFGSRVEVRRGIARGERVVTTGSFQLKSELQKETLGEDH